MFKESNPHIGGSLHQIQEVMEEPVLCLKKVIHTRWLSPSDTRGNGGTCAMFKESNPH